LPGTSGSALAWEDYDNDGDLDLAISGYVSGGCISSIYRNDGGGVFADIGAGLPGTSCGALAWGDYDNDGLPDILLNGYTGSGNLTRIYHNDGGGVFADLCAGLPSFSGGDGSWGDFDGDGDLDFVLAGDAWPEFSGDAARVYCSGVAATNTAPAAPNGLAATVDGDSVTFRWNPATDGETPAAGLSYNLRVGTTPGGNEVCPAQAAASDGRRRVPVLGNVQKRTSWALALPAGTYYWSVQAVDGAFAGSPFAPEQTLNTTAAVAEQAPREVSFALAGANPVTAVARFRFGLPADARVSLTIYDVAGRRVAGLVDGELPAGFHTVEWRGDRVAGTGAFFARFTAAGHTFTTRVVLLR